MNKKDFEKYKEIQTKMFEYQDRKEEILHEVWELNNEKLQCSQQIRHLNDELRKMLGVGKLKKFMKPQKNKNVETE